MKKLAMYINGAFETGFTGQWRDVLNPATEEAIAQEPKGSGADVDRAVAAARAAQPAWDLTAAALAMTAAPEQGRGEPLHLDGSHIQAVRDDEGDVLITLDIPAALTRDIGWQAANYDLQATNASGRVKTLCRGRLLIVEDITR